MTGGSWLGVTIRGANLSRLDLTGVDLREADLSMSDLTLATLAGARLDRAVLRDTVLDRADLRGASLDGVDLSAATLKRTKLDLAGAVLLAELHGADVDTASWLRRRAPAGRRSPGRARGRSRAATPATARPRRGVTAWRAVCSSKAWPKT